MRSQQSTSDASQPSFDAVVLAGGRSRRFGADKLAADLDGTPVLAHALAACAGADRLVVVGDPRDLPGVTVWTREEPPGGGPLAGLLAARPYLTADVIVVVGGDMPVVAPLVPRLVAALAADDTLEVAACPREDGRPAPLPVAVRRAVLDAAAQQLGSGAGTALGRLLDGRRVVLVAGGAATADVDTPEDLRRLTARSASPRDGDAGAGADAGPTAAAPSPDRPA